jgi:hypothetical protein
MLKLDASRYCQNFTKATSIIFVCAVVRVSCWPSRYFILLVLSQYVCVLKLPSDKFMVTEIFFAAHLMNYNSPYSVISDRVITANYFVMFNYCVMVEPLGDTLYLCATFNAEMSSGR